MLFALEVIRSVTSVHLARSTHEYDLADSVTMFDIVNKQDFAAAEWCQPNMTSCSYSDGGGLAPSEQLMIGRWYAWYHHAMETGR